MRAFIGIIAAVTLSLSAAFAQAVVPVDQDRGREIIARFVEANRYWLLPSLQERRGLIYEYRQEPPYTERVVFDSEGNPFAR